MRWDILTSALILLSNTIMLTTSDTLDFKVGARSKLSVHNVSIIDRAEVDFGCHSVDLNTDLSNTAKLLYNEIKDSTKYTYTMDIDIDDTNYSVDLKEEFSGDEKVSVVDVSEFDYSTEDIIEDISIIFNNDLYLPNISDNIVLYSNDNKVDRVILIHDSHCGEKGAEYNSTMREIVGLSDKSYKELFRQVLAGVEPDMSDLEKALMIHDNIVLTLDYPSKVKLDNGMEIYPKTAYHPYTALNTGYGVCNAYAELYEVALRAVGVEALYVRSRDMNHAWNMIKIEGNWYHADACWDDPVTDHPAYKYGYVSHSHFLLSDSEFLDKGYSGWILDDGSETPKAEKSNAFVGKMFRPTVTANSGRVCHINDAFYALGYNNKSSELYKTSSLDGNIEKSILNTSFSFLNQYKNKLYAIYEGSLCELNYDGTINGYVYTLNNKILNFVIKEDNFKLVYKDRSGEIKVIERSNTDLEKKLETIKINKVTYIINDKGDNTEAYALKCDEDAIDVIIQSDINGIPVTLIKSGFAKSSDVRSIEIPSSVHTIDDNAFNYTHIEEVKLNEGLEYIGDQAFFNCNSIRRIVIPSTVTHIGEKAFAYCAGLHNVFWLGKIPNINKYTFVNFENKENTMFNVLYADSSVTLQDGTVYKVKQFNKDTYKKASACGNSMSWSFKNNTLYITGTGDMWNYSASSNGTDAPWNKYRDSITNIVVSEGVESIGSWAFAKLHDLKSVSIPKSVTYLGEMSFWNSYTLKAISIPGKDVKFGKAAFSYCYSLKSLEISKLTNIPGKETYEGIEEKLAIKQN